MNDEKWVNLVGEVKDRFEVLEENTEDLEDSEGIQEILIFNGPLGKMKLVRTSRPMVIDKKTTYSNRIGGSIKVDYQYSDTEKVHKLNVYKWSDEDDNWVEINSASLG